MSSGISHHEVAATTAAIHQRLSETRFLPLVFVRMNSAGSTSALSVETAFTPPISKMATPERAAAIAAERPLAADTRGSAAHGASRPGRTAAEVDPMTIVNVGHRAKTPPASRADR